jgi:hypothetical protein
MSQALLTDPPVTIAEFDAFLDAQQDDSLWELVGMAGQRDSLRRKAPAIALCRAG